jgi:hypothetical protein
MQQGSSELGLVLEAGQEEEEEEGEGRIILLGGATPHTRVAATKAARVSPFFAWIGSPCLRHCVHGASIGGGRWRAERGEHLDRQCGGAAGDARAG